MDIDWSFKSFSIGFVTKNTASKDSIQIHAKLAVVHRENEIINGEDETIYTETSDKKAATVLSDKLLTNFVGSVSCVVHTLLLAVNDVLTEESWLSHVNNVRSYFNYLSKVVQLLIQYNLNKEITQDRVLNLKHNMQTTVALKLQSNGNVLITSQYDCISF